MIGMHGFTTFADETLEDNKLTEKEQKFLAAEFDGARERMTGLASTVGTAGSFIFVLVALLVGFANGSTDQANKLVDASQAQAQLAAGCSETPPATNCTQIKLDQAKDDVTQAQKRVQDVKNLDDAQALTGAFVMLGFILGLAGILTNPVPGPNATGGGTTAVEAWRRAVARLKLKRNWIMASLVAQIFAIASIVYVVVQVF